jgi:DNA-directed RNA polymerase specialized sigma24 family protein
MTYSNPLADSAPTDVEDRELIQLVHSGSKAVLELLISRHQGWIYNITLRMVCRPQDAEDATQDILIKVITRLSTFRGESPFRTWLYRLASKELPTGC